MHKKQIYKNFHQICIFFSNAKCKEFENYGFKSKVDFIYSVYEDENLNAVCIYYRCKVNNPAPKGYSYINFDKIPWKRISDKALRIMINRYVEESNHGNFAIYMGNETRGFVKKLK